MVRIWHPTLPVLHYWREILRKASSPTIHELRAYFRREVYDNLFTDDHPNTENGKHHEKSALRVRVGWMEEVDHEIALNDANERAEKESDPTTPRRGRKLERRSLELPGCGLRAFVSNGTPPPWGFPFELAIAVQARRRPAKAFCVLKGTLQNLLDEQAELLGGLERVIKRLTTSTADVQVELNRLHEACIELLPR
ncbi:unnamed protein product [Phytomonas sp. Hart1]|nr:unnamed protein product [Phytomonas sp. Hart1]|eukprot:CCW66205.1 unnamed protein product [Phytomonas sp. isolate Hart1]